MRTRICIDDQWRFALGDDSAAIQPGFDDAEWRVLDLPHDWSIEQTPAPDHPAGAGGGFFPGGLGWYRKQIAIPADLADKHVLIAFDGVYMNSEVWCNGHFCGVRPYGYSSFCYDLTPYVKACEDACVAVRVDNSRQRNSRWYSGSGIYRHVWLTVASAVRVDHWGTFITTPEINRAAASVVCAATVVNDTNESQTIDLLARVADVQTSRSAVTVPPLSRETVRLELTLPNPRLWSPDDPARYTLCLELQQSAQTVDTYETPFGIRSIRFDPNEGFFLNGVPTKFKGVNEHHDAGCLGAAVPDDVIRRRLGILKTMGCNAIRMAHNPASPAFLDLCDELGFMVVEDAFDEWRDGKTPFGYQMYWDQWWERDLVDMIRRDRNHPSIVMWSVGNEIKEVREGRAEGLVMMQALQAVCHREDPTRPMTCGCCNSRTTLKAGYAEFMDVFGYNGGGGGCFDYAVDHQHYPDMIMFASEVPHSLQTRGVYRTRTWYRDLARMGEFHWYPPGSYGRQVIGGTETDPEYEPEPALRDAIRVPDFTEVEVFTSFDNHYQSSYDNALVRISSIDSWRCTRDLPYLCGEFRWTGFDYLGECYGWPAKSWNFGVIDLCGFPKDTYYFYQSVWTAAPMVHVLPHWTWPGLEGKTIPVMVYTNCDRVELLCNGESLGVQAYDPVRMVLRWDIPYQPGELEAIGYRDGISESLATCAHVTADQPVELAVVCEEDTLGTDTRGVIHAVVRVVDANGVFVPSADHDVTVECSGPATLIGLENGDPIDSTNYKLNHRKVFNGMLLAILQSKGQPGTITVSAHAEGLRTGSTSVTVV